MDEERIALSVDDLKGFGGPGRTLAYEEIRRGRLRAHKLGSRTIVLRADLEAYLRDLPAFGDAE
ncbi:MAG: helix-turn-helix domain-containing protein [Acidimicrobiales bacterium]